MGPEHGAGREPKVRAVSTPEVTGYRDLVEIGRGGFARVYRAHQDRFNRAVALKVLNLADPDERTRDRFERECRAMGELSWHPHVVAVYDSGVTDDDHLYLAMEHLESGSFADDLGPASSLAWPDAVRVAVEVAGALGAAHAAGTLHRDLKPENVLVGPFGEAKLSDFGIAAVEGSRRTSAGVASFTVAHVAPEVLRGQRADERADVYGLASTLHTLLVGAPPFEVGDADEPVATTMMRILDAPVPRLAPPVPDALADLLVQALAKEPAERPQSAAALGEALQAVQAAEGLAVTPLRLARTGAGPARRIAGATTVPAGGADAPDRAPADETVTAETPVAARVTQPDSGETVTVESAAPATGAPVTNEAPAPPPPPPVPPAPPPEASRGGRRRAVLIGAAVVVVLVVAAGAVAALSGGDSSDSSSSSGPSDGSSSAAAGSSSDGAAGSSSGGATAEGTFQTDAVGGELNDIALNSDGVWVTQADAAEVVHVDPASGEVVATTPTDTPATGVATTADDRVWVIGNEGTEVGVIDDSAGEVTDAIDISSTPDAIAASTQHVWVAATDDVGGNLLADVNAATTSLANLLGSSQSGPSQVAATDDDVWVTNSGSSTVSHYDARTQVGLTAIAVDVTPGAVAVTDDAVWVAGTDSQSIVRIDPATDTVVATVDLSGDGGGSPAGIAATAGAVWVTDPDNDQLLRIDPGSNAVVDTIDTGSRPVAVAATDTDVWVANAGDGTLTHVDPTASD